MASNPDPSPVPAAPPAAAASAPPHAGGAQRRRELQRQYREQPPAMGIYAIRHPASGLVYVNAGTNVQGALARDCFCLRLGSHRDRRLQQAWRQHGEAAFRCEVVDTLKRRDDPRADDRADLAALLALWQQALQR